LIVSRRQEFNRGWTSQKYQRFRAILESQCHEDQPFRHSETPCFFPADLIDRMAAYGVEMVEQLLANSTYLDASREEIPAAYRVPNEPPRPLFIQADFGLDQNQQPKLVEIQGFPSLFSYQPAVSDAYREAFDIDPSLVSFPGGLKPAEYWSILRTAIVAEKDPENVILLEIDPSHQKTRHDFLMTERMFGVHTVDIRDLRKEGCRVYYPGVGRNSGLMVPVDRIYNRAIIDELERRDVKLPFDPRDDLDVEWAGHPNWFFRLSKFSLPWLKHPAVPRAEFLSQANPPENLADYVLKPLYSFAGAGVVVGPSQAEIDAIPAARRSSYILQERVDFQPVIDTPFGMTKVEIRIMYIWTGSGMRHVNTIVRMGRGAQMGVDFNKNYEWIGASAAFTPTT
jgi:hypothetical protein